MWLHGNHILSYFTEDREGILLANTEDYLDSLLNSVENVRQDVQQAQQQSDASRQERTDRRAHIGPEEDFMEASGIEDFEPEPTTHRNLRQAFSEEDFLRSFEEELEDDFEDQTNEDSLENFTSEDGGSQDGSLLGDINSVVSQTREEIDQGKKPTLVPEGALPPLQGYEPDALDMELLADGDTSDDSAEEPAASEEQSTEDLAAKLSDIQSELQEINRQQEEAGEDNNDLFEDIQSIINGDAGETEAPEISFVPEESGETAGSETSAEEAAVEQPPAEEPLLSEDAEVDLMDLLSGDDTLDDIGSLLESDENQVPLEEAQDAFEAQVSAASGAAEEPEQPLPKDNSDPTGQSESDGEKKKGFDLKGFFAKIKEFLLKSDDEDEEETAAQTDLDMPDNLSDKDKELLRELESSAPSAPSKGGKKAKAPKPKKEKKPKESKPKKEKKPREPRPKKERPPKEPDHSPKIPMKVVVIFLILAVSIIALVVIGQQVLGDARVRKEAKESYEQGDYLSAYEGLMGIELKDDDQELFKKARLLGDLQMRTQEYEGFMEMDQYNLALDSLLVGVARYYDNMEEAQSLQISDAYDALGAQLEQQLLEQFGIDKDEAIQISGLSRENYSIRVDEILRDLGLGD
jgi:hypothetical protein